ncbi:MAG TPA: hypothetical protein VF169_15095 [Albitalea sp.]|uniref:hypothetical protein n=1 Tax=Piscinibacter sp. TaxID=1903157 RepID=UPI002ED0105E
MRESATYSDAARDAARLTLCLADEPALLHRRSHRRPLWRLQSLRTRRVYWTTSEQEYQALLLLDADPTITDVELHPGDVRLWCGGVEHDWRPEFLVSRALEREFWCLADATTKSAAANLDVLREQLSLQGYGLVVMPWAQWCRPAALELATLVRQHARRDVDLPTRERIRRALAEQGHASWADITAGRLADLPVGAVSRLIFEGVLRLNPSDRLRPDTRVEANSSRVR